VIFDVPLVVTGLALSTFGVCMVYSAGQTDVPTVAHHAWRSQIVWVALSLCACFVASRSSVRVMEWLTWPAYLFSCFLLFVTLFFGSGAGTAASVKGWLTIGGVRFGQPAELAKVTVVLMLAKVLSQRKEPARSLLELWKPALAAGVPWLLIMAQPDLGTGLAFIGILFGMLFWSGVPVPLLVLLASPVVSLILAFSGRVWGAWFLLLLALVVWYKPYLAEGVVLMLANLATGVIAPKLWEALAPYQRHRLLVFLDPSIDPRASGWHVIQSQVAIGSGGVFGKGWTHGTQKRLAFLPAQHTDFIFSVVGEELGFVGVTLALALFLLLLLRTVRVAERANDSYSSLAAFGLATVWLVHIVVNIGMTLNLMPITGIPLPFFSYGGSSMLASWLSIGILLRISSEGRGAHRGEMAV
jgi:rod shape determining protein RodA